MAAVNWSHAEVYKLISIWSDDAIQEQLVGHRRNSQVYKKISESLAESGFSRTFEQCREKVKKLRAEYKKVKDRHKETGQGRFSEWEFYDAIGHKHSTEPPVVIESMPKSSVKLPSLSEIGPDNETQDISGSTEPVSASSSSRNSSNADASNEDQHL